MESSVVVVGAFSESDGKEAARLEERDQLAEGARAVGRGEVHPDGADEDDVEGEAGGEGVLQRGKPVVAPVDAGVVVAGPGELAHAG